MAVVSGGTCQLGKEMADALGLKHVRNLDFHIGYDSIATVKAEYYPEKDGVKQFPAILSEYELIERKRVGGVHIPIRIITKNIMCEIALTGVKTFNARMSLGILLFRFAAWVTGMQGKVTVGDQALGEMVE